MTNPTPQYAELARLLEDGTNGEASLPWRICDPFEFPWELDAPADGGPTCTILGKDGYGVLSVPSCIGDGGPHGFTRAPLIVAAVNALPDMLTALQSLQAENERLRGALEPFDNLWVWGADADEDEVLCRTENGCLSLRVEHFRNARAALTKDTSEGGGDV